MWKKFRAREIFLFLVLLFGQHRQFHVSSGVVSCALEFSIEHDRGAGVIQISTQWKSNLCGQDELSTQPYLVNTGVQPLVRVSNCKKRTAYANFTLSTGHILLAIAQLNTSIEDEGTESPTSKWTVGIPDYLLNEECVEVLVKGTTTGPGMQIAEARRDIWIHGPASNIVEDNMNCSSGCEAIDSSTYDWVTVILVRDGMGRFLLHYSILGHNNSTVDVYLPECIQTNESLSWTRYDTIEDCRDNYTSFTATRVHLTSKNDVFVTGNGLLYSPNRGESWYQLSTQLSSFATSSDRRKYAFVRNDNESIEVWVGFVGSSVIFQVYPSEILEGLCNISWNNTNFDLDNTTVEFDDQNNLYFSSGGASQSLPPALLLQNAIYKSQFTAECNVANSSTSLHDHPLSVSERTLHKLTSSCESVCPFTQVKTIAPICGSVTRSKLHLLRDGFLQHQNTTLMSEENCEILGHTLPGDIFIGQRESYSFTIEVYMKSSFPDPADVFLVKRMSEPAEVLGVELRKSFQSQFHILAFEVFLQEQKFFSGQYESGYTLVSVDIDFEILGANTQCQDTLSTDSADTPGHLETRVHIGCPPGLSLHFDVQSTTSQYKQFCSSANDISCYYFANEFHPVFEIVDSVTEERSVYNGVYTLRVLQGGTKANNMRSFSHIEDVESGIWTPVNESKDESPPLYRYGDSGIKWVCGTTSPCGEIFPLGGRTPEYYFLLEASNRVVAENDTYCELTVQFQIKIHGMGMGAVTTVTTLLFFHIVMVSTLLCTYGLWHYRLKFLYWKDIMQERLTDYWERQDNVITNLIRRHRARAKSAVDDHEEIRQEQSSTHSLVGQGM